MLKKFWLTVSKVPYAKSESERIKYSVLRGVVICFAASVFLIASFFTITRFSQAANMQTGSVALQVIWFAAATVFLFVWFLLGTRYYRYAILPWALGYVANAAILIPGGATEAIIFRVQIFLMISILIFSGFLRKRHLYSLAASYYAILMIAIYNSGLLVPHVFFPFTIASIFVVAAMELVTRIRLAEARMVEIERARALHTSRLSTLGETTAFLVHEVSSPLTILQGHLEMIQKKEDLSYHIEKMQNALNRATDFMGSVKRMVRASAADEFEAVQLSEILKMVSDLIEPSLRRRAIRLEFDYSSDVELKCRPAEIAQVIINLVNNSADAIGSRSERWVRVTAQSVGDCLEIEVTDPGSGIAPEVASKVMDPFFTTKETGSGIGLAVAQQVALNHDGRVDIIKFSNPTTIRLRVALAPKFTVGKRSSHRESKPSTGDEARL